MYCNRCGRKVEVLVKVRIDIFDPDNPKSAMHTTEEWCVTCLNREQGKSYG